jgi:hypothetical protein
MLRFRRPRAPFAAGRLLLFVLRRRRLRLCSPCRAAGGDERGELTFTAFMTFEPLGGGRDLVVELHEQRPGALDPIGPLRLLGAACGGELLQDAVGGLLGARHVFGAVVDPIVLEPPALAAACEASLAAFETSIEDDDARLGDPALPENARRCMLVRRGEKRVLRHHLSLARAAEPLLRLQGEERARAARGLAASESGLGAYLADVAESLAPPRGDEAPTLRWKPPAA